MNKILSFILIFTSFVVQAQISYADLQDGTSGISSGFGAWGPYNVVQENTLNVPGKGQITFYHPDTSATALPVIFFISGWGQPHYQYEKLFHFIASRGYAVVNIYNTNPGNIYESYQNSLDMILQAVHQEYPSLIDTTKVGLAGHSYGAGSTVWLGKQLFGSPRNWGANGRFIFMTSPWYSLLVTPDDLLNYPPDVKLLIEIANDDIHEGTTNWNTSERAIRAVFELINIPNDEKDFIRIYSDNTTYQFDSDNDGTPETYHYDANHYISYTGTNNDQGHYQPYDALDVYAVNRLLHALIAYTFEGNLQAKTVALGNGSSQQTDMDFLTDLSESDTPVITRPESRFQYPCNSDWNDFATNTNTWYLQDACDDSDGDGTIDYVQLRTAKHETGNIRIVPNPAADYIFIRFKGNNIPERATMVIYDMRGKEVLNVCWQKNKRIDISKLTTGTYRFKIFVHNEPVDTGMLVKK